MIMLFSVFLLISVVFFWFTRSIIPNTLVRIAISAIILIVLSTVMIGLVSKGHRAPPGAKVVDFEEMKKARKAVYGSGD